MFLMRPYFVSHLNLRKTSCATLLAVTLFGTMTASRAYAANTDVIVQPLGTSHGNSDVVVIPSSNALPEHSSEPEEKTAQPDTTPPGSSQSFSSLIDILQNKPRIEAAVPEGTVPEPPAQAPPAPVVKPTEPLPALPPQKLPDERIHQPPTQTPRVHIAPKDLLMVPYNNHGTGPK